MYSESFPFEIEMEPSFKQGYLRSKAIFLNITEPYKIGPAICYLKNDNLNSTVKFKCNIYNLTQENRITNGIKIGGIYKKNITDEYLVTRDNIYIKLIDLDKIIFPFIECPKLFEINRCKNTNITAKKCEKCYLNYYQYLNNSECITCSQLNEGCDSCYLSGKCNKCIKGFDLKENNCLKKTECEPDRYGPECKKCEELNQNCDECNKSGYCKRCKKGYYLTGIDINSKCVKCISTCEECDSLNKCTKCSDGLILDNEANCVSCFSLNEGCEKCNKNGKCTKCYNNKNFLYEIKNDKCVKKEEEKNEKQKEKEEKKESKTNLKFERIDGFEKEDDKVHFKSHFILLDNYLFNSIFHITVIIQVKIIIYQDFRFLRGLQETQSVEKDIICNQYGDALGNNNKGGYLANFKCTTNLEENQEALSIEPTKMEITDKDNQVIQSFETEQKSLDVNELEQISLDEEYENYLFNKLSISSISDITKKGSEISFNVIGDIDTYVDEEKEYEISLKDDDDNIINSTCHFPILIDLNDQTISCTASIDKEAKISDLSFVQGVYSAKLRNDDKLILIDNNNVNIKVPKNNIKLSTIAIIIISASAFVLAAIVVAVLIAKLVCKKKNGEEVNNQPNKVKDIRVNAINEPKNQSENRGLFVYQNKNNLNL